MGLMRRGASHGGPLKATARKPARPPLRQILHLALRLLIFIAAVTYIKLSFDSSLAAIGLLRGRDDPLLPTDESTFPLMSAFVGTTMLRQSRLLKQALGDSTLPVNGTLYLESLSTTSFTPCAKVPDIQRDIYGDPFQREVYRAVARDTSYHVLEISDSAMELITPVVDCSASVLFDGDASNGRFFYLTRQRTNPNNVSLVIVSLSNQQYSIVAQGEDGPAGVATLQLISDMRATNLDVHTIVSLGYPLEDFSFRVYKYLYTTPSWLWTLESIPASDDELTKIVKTANRDGFYIKAESEQSNINHKIWIPDPDAIKAVSRWKWSTKPVTTDSWAWVHAVQFVIGFGLMLNLTILFLSTYRIVRAGKWWVGDAFVSISTAQLANGFALGVSWFMNEYWVLHEFVFFTAYELSGVTTIYVNTGPAQAGLLTLYLTFCGLVGHLLREKIDPFFAIVCFGIGFECRIAILKAIPALHDSIVDYARYSYMRGVSAMEDGQVEISPMRLWTSHPIGARNYGFVAQTLFPIYSTVLIVVVYVFLRKVYRRIYPEPLHIQRTNNTPTMQSGNQEALIAQKRVLTLFEVATGAELENRFGIVSDYETCIFIKGMKFASADGIYCTGFIIANKKYLLQTDDFWSIVLMKVLRRRYKNIYVYEVNGSTVQQTARLVYPQTLTVQDLMNISVSVLS